ncbi:hypothetical protein ACWD0J_21045 [Streptomyces sp. NPDC003011]
MVTASRLRSPLQVFRVGGEQVTAVPMTPAELVTEDVEALQLPEDRTGLMPLRGWQVYDATGQHIGRVMARSCVLVAEWYDSHVQMDWLLAMWHCRRLERGVFEILRLRDETLRQLQIENERRAERERREAYAAGLARRGLVLDEGGDEVPAHLAPGARPVAEVLGLTAGCTSRPPLARTA